MNQRMLCTCAMAVLAVLTPVKTPESRAGAPACPDGMERVAEYRLFFGRSKQASRVTMRLARVPRKGGHAALPGGLTVLDTSGQWRDAARTPVRERTKLVLSPSPSRGPVECGAPKRSPKRTSARSARNPFCA